MTLLTIDELELGNTDASTYLPRIEKATGPLPLRPTGPHAQASLTDVSPTRAGHARLRLQGTRRRRDLVLMSIALRVVMRFFTEVILVIPRACLSGNPGLRRSLSERAHQIIARRGTIERAADAMVAGLRLGALAARNDMRTM
jgi:hypothetical protein